MDDTLLEYQKAVEKRHDYRGSGAKSDENAHFEKDFNAVRAMQSFFNSLSMRVHPEMVDFGSGQGRSDFETAGVVKLRRGFQKSENAGLGQKMPFMVGH